MMACGYDGRAEHPGLVPAHRGGVPAGAGSLIGSYATGTPTPDSEVNVPVSLPFDPRALGILHRAAPDFPRDLFARPPQDRACGHRGPILPRVAVWEARDQWGNFCRLGLGISYRKPPETGWGCGSCQPPGDLSRPSYHSPASASSRARIRAMALFTVSWNSLAGSESATIPAPTWRYT